MVPGAVVVAWQSRYFESGRPCDTGDGEPCPQCRGLLRIAAADLARDVGPMFSALCARPARGGTIVSLDEALDRAVIDAPEAFEL